MEPRWTKKHDNKHKAIRHYAVTSAEVHDSQVFETLLDENKSSGGDWADSAHCDKAREEALTRADYRSKIHRNGSRKRPLNERKQTANRKRPKIRARVEHVFAQQADRLIHTIGKVRAEAKIGLMNVAYNMRWLAWLAG